MATKYKTGGVTVTIGKSQDVSIPSRIFRGRATCMHFDTDKSFLLPPSVKGVRNIVSFFNRHAGTNMLVNGHTDLVGDAQYNLQLSNERANAVAAYLLNTVDDWLQWYHSPIQSKRWSTLEDQYMLQTINDSSGSPYYNGAASGYADSATQDAIKRFQTDNSLEADGVAGDDTRRALIAKYMALEGTSLPASTQLVKHGCGKYHPIDPTTQADQGNRRVEIFLFEGPIDPPPQATCPAPGCTEYGQWVGNPDEDVDLCTSADLLVIVTDTATPPNRLANAKVTIDQPDFKEQTTDKDGTTMFFGVAGGKVHVTAVLGETTRETDVEVQPGVSPSKPPPSSSSSSTRSNLVDSDNAAASPDGGAADGDPSTQPNTAVVTMPTPRLRMSLFDMNTGFTFSKKFQQGSLVGVNFETALLDAFRDARFDDYSLVTTINFGGTVSQGSFDPKPPVWDYLPLGDASLRVSYLKGLITEIHNRKGQVIVGYARVEKGSTPQPANQPFLQWLAGASTAQVTQHGNDIVSFFTNQGIDIDGVGFDFELNGLGSAHAANLSTLFSTVAGALKSGGVVYYDTGPFQPNDGQGSTGNLTVLNYALSNVAANVIARPMCYNGSVTPKQTISDSIDCALKPAPGGGVTSSHVQMAIDFSRTSDADMLDMCTNVFRQKLVGLTVYTMPIVKTAAGAMDVTQTKAAQQAMFARAKTWEAALNPAGVAGPGTSGQPLQVPLP